MITASIVLFHTPEELLYKVVNSYAPCPERKLYLIDNSEYPMEYAKKMSGENVSYIFNHKNLGYGSAHNIGIQRAVDEASDYHIVLNPDIEFEPSVIDELCSYADQHPDIVYILPKVVSPNGEVQYLCKLLPMPFDLIFRRFLPCSKIAESRNDKYVLKDFGYDRIINPPCLSGCFMFMRTSVLKKYHIEFDSRFFMYLEDFDLIRRLHRVGKTIYYPYVEIVHKHSKESYKNSKMLKVHMTSAVKYFNKYGWFFDAERKKMNAEIMEELKKLYRTECADFVEGKID